MRTSKKGEKKVCGARHGNGRYKDKQERVSVRGRVRVSGAMTMWSVRTVAMMWCVRPVAMMWCVRMVSLRRTRLLSVSAAPTETSGLRRGAGSVSRA